MTSSLMKSLSNPHRVPLVLKCFGSLEACVRGSGIDSFFKSVAIHKCLKRLFLCSSSQVQN